MSNVARLSISIFICLLMGLANALAESNNKIDNLYIGEFSQGKLDGWQEKAFSGSTLYELVEELNAKGSSKKQVLKAISHNSASGLFKEQQIDLQQTPYLNWSWKTDSLYSGLNEKQKKGDDFVARIYIVIDGGMFFWKTQALNYVWSSTFEKNDSWPNPYTENATMYSVESGKENLGKWISYQRNVRDDIKNIIGKEVRYIDAIAVMTDSDSSGQQATSYYGDIFFSAQP